LKIHVDIHPVKVSGHDLCMGMRTGYEPPHGSIDAVSATANISGFTQLTAIAGHYGWKAADITRIARMANERKEIGVARGTEPLLIVVPQTKAAFGADALSIMKDLLAACRESAVQTLHFTHYGMLLTERPLSEMKALLAFLATYDEDTSLQTIIWDVDDRYAADVERERNVARIVE